MGIVTVVIMAFASPRSARSTPRTTGGDTYRSSSPAATPRAVQYETIGNEQQYLWPSETDPRRAHWLRNEVIAFERRLLTLRAERDEVVGLLRQDEEAREKAVLLENEIQQVVEQF